MDKKGFIRILEAVVALLIVFGALLAILPSGSDSVSESKIPYELESSANTILKEIENNEAFRVCIITGTSSESTAPECVSEFVGATLPYGSVLEYAFSIIPDGEDPIYYNSEGAPIIDLTAVVPLDVNIYSKSIFIGVDDVTAFTPEWATSKEYKTLRLYFWFKLD